MKTAHWIYTLALAIIFTSLMGCNQTNAISDFAPSTTSPSPNAMEIPSNSEYSHGDSEPKQLESANKTNVKEIEKDVLLIQPECAVIPGWDASFLVTSQGNSVQGAQVLVNQEEAGVTDNLGRISISIPYTQDITINAELGELNGELVLDLSTEAG
jgi:hypothetical protein